MVLLVTTDLSNSLQEDTSKLDDASTVGEMVRQVLDQHTPADCHTVLITSKHSPVASDIYRSVSHTIDFYFLKPCLSRIW